MRKLEGSVWNTIRMFLLEGRFQYLKFFLFYSTRMFLECSFLTSSFMFSLSLSLSLCGFSSEQFFLLATGFFVSFASTSNDRYWEWSVIHFWDFFGRQFNRQFPRQFPLTNRCAPMYHWPWQKCFNFRNQFWRHTFARKVRRSSR